MSRAHFYRRDTFAPVLRGRDAVLLCLPSTSGENAIPAAFAARLASEFGGRVVERVGRPLATTEAKKRRLFSQKLSDPTRFEIYPETLDALRRPCLIVDDVPSSGDSLVALRRALGADLALLVLAGWAALEIRAVRLDDAARRLADLAGCRRPSF